MARKISIRHSSKMAPQLTKESWDIHSGGKKKKRDLQPKDMVVDSISDIEPRQVTVIRLSAVYLMGHALDRFY